MLSRVILLALLAALGLVEAGFISRPDSIFAPGALIARQNRGKFGGNRGKGGGGGGNNRQNNNNNNNGGGGGGGGGNCLNPKVKQTASDKTGQEQGTQGVKKGQAKSLTDANNFLNFCADKGAITDGKQQKGGSCNPIPMGQIPAQAKMVSAIITNPKPGDKLPSGKDFKINVQMKNMQAGQFTNPTTTYYTAPQFLNQQGLVVGHVHVTVQNIGSMTPSQPPDPAQFAFFKGIDDAGNGQGLLTADVAGGLPAGTYRVCTIVAAANHQPVAMPVAQRGAQDDCTKFEVQGGGGGGGNNNGGKNNGGNNNNNGKNNNGKNNGGNNRAQQGGGNRGGGGRGRGRRV